MRNNKFCLNCGSQSFVSDRSLGGKIVCVRCGSSSFKNKPFTRISNNKIVFYLIGIIVLLIVIL